MAFLDRLGSRVPFVVCSAAPWIILAMALAFRRNSRTGFFLIGRPFGDAPAG